MTFLMRKAMNKSLSQYGLTSSHAFYLIALNLQGPQTLLELSDFLDIDPGNTNRVIRLLTEMGLVDDDRESPRSKRYRVFLTDKGKELSEQVMRDTNEQMNAYFEGISDERIQDLRTTLVDILQNVDPEFHTYVDSKYINPFYTYLGVFTKDPEFTVYPRRIRDEGSD
jgi:DNA-binding MarR family transcriptional regulator